MHVSHFLASCTQQNVHSAKRASCCYKESLRTCLHSGSSTPSITPSRPSHSSPSFRQSCLPTRRDIYQYGRLHCIRSPYCLYYGVSYRFLFQRSLALLTRVQAFISALHFIPSICSGTWVGSKSSLNFIFISFLPVGGVVYANHCLDNACPEL